MNLKLRPKEKYVVPVMYPVEKKCAADATACDPTKKDVAAYKKEAAGISKSYAAAKIPPEMVEIMPIEYQQVLRQKYRFAHRFPSTGITALVYCLEHYPESVVSVIGFDFAAEEPSIGHYWERIFKLRTVHSYKRERQFVLQLASTGRVKILK